MVGWSGVAAGVDRGGREVGGANGALTGMTEGGLAGSAAACLEGGLSGGGC